MKFLFTCGGTAGHIYPAIAVADRLRELFPESEFLFIGVDGEMETELVPHEGYPIKTLNVSGLRRGIRPKDIIYNVRTAVRTETAFIKAKRIVRSFQPDAVLGTGGYVCFPVIRAASLSGIPTFIHESNAYPGLTTKMLEKYSTAIMVGFEESRQYYKHPEEVLFTGTPVRKGFTSLNRAEAKKEMGYPSDKPLVLSFWGSLGASKMNEYTARIIAENEKSGIFYHIHATGGGENGLRRMTELLEKEGVRETKYTDVRAFIYNMPTAMAAADMVLCRSGASTLAELTATGTPTLQVPSKNVTNNHQEKNARVLEKNGGAIVITEPECSAEAMLSALEQTLSSSEKTARMAEAMLGMGRPDAVDIITNTIIKNLKTR